MLVILGKHYIFLHFSSFFLPFLIDEIVAIRSHYSITFLKFWLILLVYLLATKPARRKIYPALLIFRAIDRPDDRPYTLKWMVTQFIASSLVILPFKALWDDWGGTYGEDFVEDLIFILVMVNGLGDGLAEPVGIKFGKYHLFGRELTYRTRAIWYQGKFWNGSFKRSYPGSFTVWIVTLISILIFNDPFTTAQWIACLIYLPIIMTLTEAFSPRTWDSPFLFLIGAIVLSWIIKSSTSFLIVINIMIVLGLITCLGFYFYHHKNNREDNNSNSNPNSNVNPNIDIEKASNNN